MDTLQSIMKTDRDLTNYYKVGTQVLHRVDGPAVTYLNQYTAWYFEGQYHCETGPALVFNGGSKSWYIHGMRHRTDGPAIEYVNGNKCWFINDKQLTEEEFKALV
jgi:hypothetical protein